MTAKKSLSEAIHCVQKAAKSFEDQSSADFDSQEEGLNSATADVEAMIDMMHVSAYTWRNDALADLDFGIVCRDGSKDSKVILTLARLGERGREGGRTSWQASELMPARCSCRYSLA